LLFTTLPTPNKDSVLGEKKKIVPTVSWSVGEAPHLVPLLNTAQWTKSMNIVMLRKGMVFKVRILFCLTAHIAHANYVAKCNAPSCLLPFIVRNRILLYGAHPGFYAKFKEKVLVYLDNVVVWYRQFGNLWLRQ